LRRASDQAIACCGFKPSSGHTLASRSREQPNAAAKATSDRGRLDGSSALKLTKVVQATTTMLKAITLSTAARAIERSEGRQGEGDAVGHGKGRHDLQLRPEPSADKINASTIGM